MANRCPDCNKFVGVEVNVDSTEVEDFEPECGVVVLHLTVNKVCAECGSEVATATVDLELDVDDKKWAEALKQAEFEPA